MAGGSMKLMKPCAYCGRENQDEVTCCVECGTAEFVPATAPVPEKFGPTISKRTKAICAGTVIVMLLILLFGPVLGLSSRRVSAPTAICFVGNATSTPGRLGFVVSNQSDSTIVYLAYPPQTESNGVWMNGPRPAGPGRMLTLEAHEVVTNVITGLTQGEQYRIPVLWGYQPTHWQWIRHRTMTFLTRRDRGFTLETYTNFSPAIQLP
jgi:hypothetical protein